METHNSQDHESNKNNTSGGLTSNRQSSSRWTPTSDQIRILKDLYYNNGVRSPSAEQIQRISARLRQYGKIEGKNVFYWFQNHKARDRQKKRFSSTPTTTDHHHLIHQRPPPPTTNWKPSDYDTNKHHNNIINPGYYSASSGSASGMNGHLGNYGSMTMENHFRGCSISPPGGKNHNLGNWVSIDHDPRRRSTSYNFFDKKKSVVNHEEFEEDKEEFKEDDESKRTLPLFPMHGEDVNDGFSYKPNQPTNLDQSFYSGWYGANFDNTAYANGTSFASLELTLNSYAPE